MAIDKFNMRGIIKDFPKQFKLGLASAEHIKANFKPTKIVICGIGGSALAGNLLQAFLQDKKIFVPFYINRDYDLPFAPDKKTLLIFISYSGNTAETLQSFNTLALKKRLPAIVVTSGGKLKALAQKHNIPLCEIVPGYQPRMTLGFQFAILAKILHTYKIIDHISDIAKLEKTLDVNNLEKKGKSLAIKLKNKVPVIYTSNRLKSLARIWKIKLNENAKIPAFFNYFPELNHNEMVSYTNATKTTKNLTVIILKDPSDGKRIIKRMDLTAALIKNKNISVNSITLTGKNFLEKVFTSLILSDWLSYYLALNQKIDPTPVKIVEKFKNSLKGK